MTAAKLCHRALFMRRAAVWFSSPFAFPLDIQKNPDTVLPAVEPLHLDSI
jgi:hypothetical protein